MLNNRKQTNTRPPTPSAHMWVHTHRCTCTHRDMDKLHMDTCAPQVHV